MCIFCDIKYILGKSIEKMFIEKIATLKYVFRPAQQIEHLKNQGPYVAR